MHFLPVNAQWPHPLRLLHLCLWSEQGSTRERERERALQVCGQRVPYKATQSNDMFDYIHVWLRSVALSACLEKNEIFPPKTSPCTHLPSTPSRSCTLDRFANFTDPIGWSLPHLISLMLHLSSQNLPTRQNDGHIPRKSINFSMPAQTLVPAHLMFTSCWTLHNKHGSLIIYVAT